MIISVINMTEGLLPDADLQCAIRANRQIDGDYAPYWSFGAQLRLEGKVSRFSRRVHFSAEDMRGDAILYVRNVVRVREADGLHKTNFSGIPYGVVAVSNFVLPLHFTSSDERGGRNDFLGTVPKAGRTLRSFSVNPGDYIGFFDPGKNEHTEYSLDDDPKGKRRPAAKRGLQAGRGRRPRLS